MFNTAICSMSPDKLFDHVQTIIDHHEELRNLHGDEFFSFYKRYITAQIQLIDQPSTQIFNHNPAIEGKSN